MTQTPWHQRHSHLAPRLLIGLLLFCLSVALYSWSLNSERFTDPDSFYHIAMAEIIRDTHNIPHTFSWLPYTSLGTHYTDHHFLYHVLLIPFVTLLPPFLGAKILTIILASLVIVGIYALLVKNKAPFSELWILALLLSSSFLFRMGLVKAPSTSALFLIVSVMLLLQPRWHRFLLLVSFFFVWSYGGFIVLPLLAACLSLGGAGAWLINRTTERRTQAISLLKAFGIILIGTASGLLIHPSFPDHFALIWQQLIVIGILNAQDVIGVGREWYPIAVSNMLLRDSIVLIPWLLSSIFALTRYKRLSGETIGLFLYSSILLVFTLKSQRYIEYLIPWAVISGAFLLRDTVRNESTHRASLSIFLETIEQRMTRYIQTPKSVILYANHGAIAILSILLIAIIGIQNITNVHADLQSGFVYSDTKAASQAIAAHTQPGDIVFHSDWDMFPQLFYWNRQNHYIVGLDPTFLYHQDPARYWLWHDITLGTQKDNVFEHIRDDFHAKAVIVETSNNGMLRLIKADPRFIEIFADSDYFVFTLQEPSS